MDCATCAAGYTPLNNSCVFLPGSLSSCSNRIKDGNEADIDCGGPQCPACAVAVSTIAGVNSRVLMAAGGGGVVVLIVLAIVLACVVRKRRRARRRIDPNDHARRVSYTAEMASRIVPWRGGSRTGMKVQLAGGVMSKAKAKPDGHATPHIVKVAPRKQKQSSQRVAPSPAGWTPTMSAVLPAPPPSTGTPRAARPNRQTQPPQSPQPPPPPRRVVKDEVL